MKKDTNWYENIEEIKVIFLKPDGNSKRRSWLFRGFLFINFVTSAWAKYMERV